MLWVIEGPDRTGKTSLARRLRELYCGEIRHFSAPELSSATREYVEPLLAYEPGTGQNVYVDRHYLGECVWPSFFGRESTMTAADRTCIELFLMTKGALCVLADREPHDLAAACADEPIAGRTGKVREVFGTAASESILPWWRYQHGDDLRALVSQARVQECAAYLGYAETVSTKRGLILENLVR